MTTKTLTFRWRDLVLVGSLHLPDARASSPVVAMIQGSGPADRTSNGYFPPIREAFLARGIGTFAFDKPGCGDSTGDWRDHGLDARADQVQTALRTIRHHPQAKADRIGVWGQSQGGWLVQMLAGRSLDLSFAIANSGPSINLTDQDLYGCEHSMRANGHSEDDVELALDFMADIHEAARERLPYETVEARLLAPARSQSWYGYMTIESEADWRLVSRFVNEHYEPLEALQQIRSPFLAVYGGRDVLLPAWQSARETGHALQSAGNQDAAVVVFPDGDHRIQHNPGNFVNGYLELLTEWAANHVA